MSDLPAVIDFILEKTQQTQLTYVGHSQGGSAIAVLLSERPDYNEKILSIHLMASAIFLKYHNRILEPFLKNLNEIKVCLKTKQFNHSIILLTVIFLFVFFV